MPKLSVDFADEGPLQPVAAIGSVIIPAYNEEASIGLCLSALLARARQGEFEVIVVCNGCTDGTAKAARAFGSMVRVIEIEVGSKVIAVNLGNKAARHFPRLYLDGDLELSTETARALLTAAAQPSCLAAICRMETEVSGASWLLRQYCAVWNRQAYMAHGKFGGAYALSEEGCRQVSVLPPVTNDDEYVRRRIPADQVKLVEGCSFRAQMPRTLKDLLAVRTRVHRGNLQLRELARAQGLSMPQHAKSQSLRGLAATAWRRPDLWVGLIVYVGINALSKLKARKAGVRWGRDESSRRARAAGQA